MKNKVYVVTMRIRVLAHNPRAAVKKAEQDMYPSDRIYIVNESAGNGTKFAVDTIRGTLHRWDSKEKIWEEVVE